MGESVNMNLFPHTSVLTSISSNHGIFFYFWEINQIALVHRKSLKIRRILYSCYPPFVIVILR